MPYLTDEKCDQCGGKFWINRFYDEKERKSYIDGATCQNCFKNVVLSDEDYNSFVNKFGEM